MEQIMPNDASLAIAELACRYSGDAMINRAALLLTILDYAPGVISVGFIVLSNQSPLIG